MTKRACVWHPTHEQYTRSNLTSNCRFFCFYEIIQKKEEDFFLSGTMPIEKEDGWQYSTCQVATVSVTKMTHYKYKTLWCNMQVHSLIISYMCELIRPPSVAPEWPRHSLWLMRICDFRFLFGHLRFCYILFSFSNSAMSSLALRSSSASFWALALAQFDDCSWLASSLMTPSSSSVSSSWPLTTALSRLSLAARISLTNLICSWYSRSPNPAARSLKSSSALNDPSFSAEIFLLLFYVKLY